MSEDKYQDAVDALHDATIRDFLEDANIFSCGEEDGQFYVYLSSCGYSYELSNDINKVRTTVRELFALYMIKGNERESIENLRDDLKFVLKDIEEYLAGKE